MELGFPVCSVWDFAVLARRRCPSLIFRGYNRVVLILTPVVPLYALAPAGPNLGKHAKAPSALQVPLNTKCSAASQLLNKGRLRFSTEPRIHRNRITNPSS